MRDSFGHGDACVPASAVTTTVPDVRACAGRRRPPAPGRVLARGAAALLGELGWAVLHELPLGNRRRVDLAAIDAKGRIAIVEVKSSLADWRADAKWPEYLPWCDLFYFAVPEDFPRAVLDEAGGAVGPAGVMVVDGFSGAIVRPARERRLAPARRRALTLRFARAAARRLNRRACGVPPADPHACR